jgi:hypothetical protein
MAATPAFKAAWRRARRDAYLLVKIVLPGGTARGVSPLTLYLSSAEVATPAGTSQSAMTWENAITGVSSIVADGAFMSSDMALVPATLDVAVKKLGPQAAGQTTAHLLRDYRWDESATCSLYLWVAGLTSFDDALPILLNARVQTADPGADVVKVYVRQRADWNGPVADVVAQRDKFRSLPDSSVGQTIPVCYGKLRPPKMRAPYAAEYGNEERIRRRGRSGESAGEGPGGEPHD